MADRVRNLLASTEPSTKQSTGYDFTFIIWQDQSNLCVHLVCFCNSICSKTVRDCVTYSSAKKKKLSSAAPLSDQRTTPAKSAIISNIRTPSGRQSTTNDLNRKTCADNVQKIIAVLQCDEEFYNRLNLNNGLKSMSAKQFLDIIVHFIGIISGKVINIHRSNECETEILKFIKSLNYPSPVNKSWLKTPTAPHAYHECVALLAWMSDLIGEHYIDANINAFYSNECDADFPNVEYTKLFSKEIQNGFQLWNRQHDEGYKKWKEDLVEEHLIARMKNRIRNIDELYDLTKNMRIDIDKLKQNDYTIHNEQYAEDVVERMHCNAARKKSLEQNIDEKTKKFAALELTYRDLQNTIDAHHQRIEKKQEIISKQRWNIDEFQLAKAKLLMLEQNIKYLRLEIETIKHDSESHQLHIARLTQQKNVAIATINSIGFKMTRISLMLKPSIEFDANAIHIETNAKNDVVRATCKTIECLCKSIQSLKQKIAFTIEQEKLQLSKLILIEQQCSDRSDAQVMQLQMLSGRLDETNQTLLKRQNSYHKIVRDLETQLDREIENRNKLQIEISATIERIAQLRAENVRVLAEGECKAAEMIDLKSKIIENLDIAIGKFVNERN